MPRGYPGPKCSWCRGKGEFPVGFPCGKCRGSGLRHNPPTPPRRITYEETQARQPCFVWPSDGWSHKNDSLPLHASVALPFTCHIDLNTLSPERSFLHLEQTPTEAGPWFGIHKHRGTLLPRTRNKVTEEEVSKRKRIGGRNKYD